MHKPLHAETGVLHFSEHTLKVEGLLVLLISKIRMRIQRASWRLASP